MSQSKNEKTQSQSRGRFTVSREIVGGRRVRIDAETWQTIGGREALVLSQRRTLAEIEATDKAARRANGDRRLGKVAVGRLIFGQAPDRNKRNAKKPETLRPDRGSRGRRRPGRFTDDIRPQQTAKPERWLSLRQRLDAGQTLNRSERRMLAHIISGPKTRGNNPHKAAAERKAAAEAKAAQAAAQAEATGIGFCVQRFVWTGICSLYIDGDNPLALVWHNGSARVWRRGLPWFPGYRPERQSQTAAALVAELQASLGTDPALESVRLLKPGEQTTAQAAKLQAEAKAAARAAARAATKAEAAAAQAEAEKRRAAADSLLLHWAKRHGVTLHRAAEIEAAQAAAAERKAAERKAAAAQAAAAAGTQPLSDAALAAALAVELGKKRRTKAAVAMVGAILWDRVCSIDVPREQLDGWIRANWEPAKAEALDWAKRIQLQDRRKAEAAAAQAEAAKSPEQRAAERKAARIAGMAAERAAAAEAAAKRAAVAKPEPAAQAEADRAARAKAAAARKAAQAEAAAAALERRALAERKAAQRLQADPVKAAALAKARAEKSARKAAAAAALAEARAAIIAKAQARAAAAQAEA